ncbi:MAG: ATP-grasp domain-containing protein [Candidatus Baldrarchaeia archaeon]
MRLFEFEAKEIFKKFGIPVPEGLTVSSQAEVASTIEKIGLPVVIKAQVLAGRRGKAGGIKFAYSLEEAVKEVGKMLNNKIGGHTVKGVLIEEKIDIEHEYYLGVTIDQFSKCPIVMFSTEGGMEIEEIVKRKPETIISMNVNVLRGFF